MPEGGSPPATSRRAVAVGAAFLMLLAIGVIACLAFLAVPGDDRALLDRPENGLGAIVLEADGADPEIFRIVCADLDKVVENELRGSRGIGSPSPLMDMR